MATARSRKAMDNKNVQQTSTKYNANHLRGVIILKELEEDKRFAATEERIKKLTKLNK
jgi:hypothetical protein